MMTKDKLLEKLRKDIENTEQKIYDNEHPTIKNKIMSGLLKGGVTLKYCIPFIISFIMVAYYTHELTNKTIFIDKVKDKAHIEYMITSTGIERQKISYDIKYGDTKYDDTIIYSTGWSENENNEFERKEYIYDYTLNDSMFDIDKLSMLTKEDLDNYLSVIDTKTIIKPYLNIEDDIYNNSMIIFKKYEISEDIYRMRNETVSENVSDFVSLLLAIYLVAQLVSITMDYVDKKYLDRKINELELKYRLLNKSELLELKNILENKKSNLEIITNQKIKRIGGKNE